MTNTNDWASASPLPYVLDRAKGSCPLGQLDGSDSTAFTACLVSVSTTSLELLWCRDCEGHVPESADSRNDAVDIMVLSLSQITHVYVSASVMSVEYVQQQQQSSTMQQNAAIENRFKNGSEHKGFAIQFDDAGDAQRLAACLRRAQTFFTAAMLWVNSHATSKHEDSGLRLNMQCGNGVNVAIDGLQWGTLLTLPDSWSAVLSGKRTRASRHASTKLTIEATTDKGAAMVELTAAALKSQQRVDRPVSVVVNMQFVMPQPTRGSNIDVPQLHLVLYPPHAARQSTAAKQNQHAERSSSIIDLNALRPQSALHQHVVSSGALAAAAVAMLAVMVMTSSSWLMTSSYQLRWWTALTVLIGLAAVAVWQLFSSMWRVVLTRACWSVAITACGVVQRPAPQQHAERLAAADQVRDEDEVETDDEVSTAPQRSVIAADAAAAAVVVQKAVSSKSMKAKLDVKPFDNSTMFERYVAACKGDEQRARERFDADVQWRADNGIDNLLHDPQPHFDLGKRIYRHGLWCWTKDGYPVYFEAAGQARKVYDTLTSQGIDTKEMMRHFIFTKEYLFNVSDARGVPYGRVYQLFDMKGLGLFDLTGSALKFIMELKDVYIHYPERLYKVTVVNAPSSFTAVWRMFRPWLDPATQDKVQIFSDMASATKILLQDIKEADLPVAYGGQNATDLYDSLDEVELLDYVHSLNTTLK